MKWRAGTQLLGLVSGTMFVLVTCRPRVGVLTTGLRSPWHWVAEAGPDAAVIAVAGALLWLVAVWVAFALMVNAAALLPGRFGQLGSAAARRLTPVTLRRVIVAATSTSILLSPATALATPGGGGAPSPSGTASMPAVGWPTDPGPASHPAPVHRTGPHAPPAVERAGVPVGTAQVRVAVGSSLWSIAGHRLGPNATRARIQQEWPRWYAENRQLIGPDPNVIRAGTTLRVPGSTPAIDAATGDGPR